MLLHSTKIQGLLFEIKHSKEHPDMLACLMVVVKGCLRLKDILMGFEMDIEMDMMLGVEMDDMIEMTWDIPMDIETEMMMMHGLVVMDEVLLALEMTRMLESMYGGSGVYCF